MGGAQGARQDQALCSLSQILTFINDSSQGGPKWEASQINFTVGVRGTIRKDTFFSKLSNLGVSAGKHPKKVGRRTLEMHDLLLKSYYQVKFNPSTEQDSFELAKTEKQSRAVHHKLFFFLVVFISTCLVTVTPQCILFSEMVKKDNKVKLEIGHTLLRCPLPFLVPTLGFFPCARGRFSSYASIV